MLYTCGIDYNVVTNQEARDLYNKKCKLEGYENHSKRARLIIRKVKLWLSLWTIVLGISSVLGIGTIVMIVSKAPEVIPILFLLVPIIGLVTIDFVLTLIRVLGSGYMYDKSDDSVHNLLGKSENIYYLYDPYPEGLSF